MPKARKVSSIRRMSSIDSDTGSAPAWAPKPHQFSVRVDLRCRCRRSPDFAKRSLLVVLPKNLGTELQRRGPVESSRAHTERRQHRADGSSSKALTRERCPGGTSPARYASRARSKERERGHAPALPGQSRSTWVTEPFAACPLALCQRSATRRIAERVCRAFRLRTHTQTIIRRPQGPDARKPALWTAVVCIASYA